MKKRLSKRDRAEALLRIPEYKKDLERLSQFTEKWIKEEEAFIKKYAITVESEIEGKKVVFETLKKPQSEKLINLNETNLHQYLKKKEAICRKYDLSTLVTPALIKSLRNPKMTAIHKKTGRMIPQEILGKKAPEIIEREKNRQIKQTALFRRDKNIVNIPVDLNLPEKESKFLALKDIEALYMAMDKLREKPEGRNREFVYDKWEIYDMHHIEDLNLSQIAKKKSGINKNPSMNENVKANIKAAAEMAVRRAYDSALENIEQVKAGIERQTISFPSSPNEVEEIVKKVRAIIKR